MDEVVPVRIRRRPRRLRARPKPILHVQEILAWADAHFKRTGRWPLRTDGRIRDARDETWSAVDTALDAGLRGLPKGSSLPQFLAEHRGVRHRLRLPPFTVAQILAWADAHYARTGRWPEATAGPIIDAPGETWGAVQAALAHGSRGMSGGSSLARLLTQYRGVRNLHALPPLSVEQIVAWADDFYARHERWPKATSGEIPDSNGETWAGIDSALHAGIRSLAGGARLAGLLAEHRGKRNHLALPRLTTKQILAWADAHRGRTGRWPRVLSGAVVDAPGETWLGINTALATGSRGLPGGSSIALLLAKHRAVPYRRKLPPLSTSQILAWADAYLKRSGRFPIATAGVIPHSGGESWRTIDKALRKGARGLPKTSLARLLARRRASGRIVHGRLLERSRILHWLKMHYRIFGKWPTARSGAVAGVEGEKWINIDLSLRHGYRDLPGGDSLHKLVESLTKKSRRTSKGRNRDGEDRRRGSPERSVGRGS